MTRTQNQRGARGFSTAQQGQYRPLVDRAWAAICREGGTGFAAGDKAAREAWYRAELAIASGGHTSTTAISRHRGFEQCCAHFEAIAGDSFQWQLRAENGDETRIRHALEKRHPGWLVRHFGGNRSLRDYLLGIARQATGRPDLAALWRLTDAQIVTVTRAILIEAARG